MIALLLIVSFCLIVMSWLRLLDRADLRRERERFPCGHRRMDWDDTYGDCALCKLLYTARIGELVLDDDLV